MRIRRLSSASAALVALGFACGDGALSSRKLDAGSPLATGGSPKGTGGSSSSTVGTGGVPGTGGTVVGTGGTVVGTGGTVVGTGGTVVGTGGTVVGTGGTVVGTGGSLPVTTVPRATGGAPGGGAGGGSTAMGTGGAPATGYVYAGHTFSCKALPAGDADGCALPAPSCLGYQGVEVDASTESLRFPWGCTIILGPNHPYYPGSAVTVQCSKSDTYLWLCLM